jgi:DnaK suppressor protein
VHEQFVTLSHHSRDRNTIRLINAALDRIDRGEYGICEDCEAEISTKRLQAMPWASRCVPCQERVEARGLEADSHSVTYA